MKCKTIQSALGGWAKDLSKVEKDITAWLQENPEAKIISITQVAFGVQSILTTILYE
jgi:translation elongation factor EF-1beta